VLFSPDVTVQAQKNLHPCLWCSFESFTRKRVYKLAGD
jgi:hypothetical protein